MDLSSGRDTFVSVQLASLPGEESTWAQGGRRLVVDRPPPSADPAHRGLWFRSLLP